MLASRSLWPRWLAVLTFALLLVACGGDDEIVPTDEPPPAEEEPRFNQNGSISGSILVPEVKQASATRREAEPNGAPDAAQDLGTLRAGQTLTVQGDTRTDGGADPFDGYQFLAPERVRVTVALRYPADGDRDFDVGLFDLASMQLVETVAASHSPTSFTFHAKGAFQLVVGAAAGNGAYALSVWASAPSSPVVLPATAVGDGSAAAWMGAFEPGDDLDVQGRTGSGSESRMLLSFPVACRIQVRGRLPDDAMLFAEDATMDVTDAAPGTLLLEGGPVEASGALQVAGGSLLWLRVDGTYAGQPWSLSLAGHEPVTILHKTYAEGGRGIAPLRTEARHWRGRYQAKAYGEPLHEFVAGRALVGFRDRGASTASTALAQVGARVERDVPDASARLALTVPTGLKGTDAARWTLSRIAALKGRAEIAYAEPDYIWHAHAEPNDTHYGLQWHYPLIHLDDAWDLTTGSSSIIVAVVDTGRTNHPDLAGRQSGGYDFISDPSNAADGNGQDSDPTDPGDRTSSLSTSSFHGTHVAGTIGATTNNATGVAGVTWQTQIMHCRVLGRFGGTVSDIADAVRYAARLSNGTGALPPQRAHVINMSLGGGGFTQTMQNAVTAARNAGVVIFASAGNESTSSPSYPASLDGVNSISAVDYNANLAPYSNYGSTIDFAAPGGDLSVDRNGDGYGDGVLSTLYDDSVNPPQAVYAFYQGTSMSCPHAVGVAALVLGVNPTLTPAQVEALLASTATDLGAPGRDNTYGHGLVNARAAVLAAQNGGTGPPELLLSPPSVSLGPEDSEAIVQVVNVGGGTVTVQTLTPITDGGGNWLDVATIGTGDATRNIDGLRITVNRTGLAEATYTGRIEVVSTGGNRTVPVQMVVQDAPPLPDDVDIIVRVVVADLGSVYSETRVNPMTGLSYTLPELPPGSYFVVAGTDLDGDGQICDEGEYCGTYPVTGEPIQVTIEPRQDRVGIDFLVAPVDQVDTMGTLPAPK